MTGFFWNLLFFVVAISILVTLHEFGHFWVARRCGIKVLRFSIGFGSALWRWQDRQGTEYVIAAIPLGGYVRMLDGRVDPVPESQRHESFDAQTVWKRMAVVLAGPIANLLFAVFALWLMFLIGVPTVRPIIGGVSDASPAARAGLPARGEIVAVGGVDVSNWEEVSLQLVRHVGHDETTLAVRESDTLTPRNYSLDLTGWTLDPDRPDVLGGLGIRPFYPDITPVISQVEAGSAGDTAGLRVGDRLVAVDDEPIADWRSLVKDIQAHPGQLMHVVVERGGAQQTLSVIPGRRVVDGAEVGYLGVSPTVEPWPEAYRITQKYPLGEAFYRALTRTGQIIDLIVGFLGKLVTATVSLDNLSGPISIAQGAGASADLGWLYFLSFLALISINLGVINLVPLPVLDGGHLLFFVIEAIRGRPVSEKVQELGLKIGWGILVALMGIALFNDITRP